MGSYFISVCVLLSTISLSVQPNTGITNSTIVANDAQRTTISSLKCLLTSFWLLRSVAKLLNGELDGNTVFSELSYFFILSLVATVTKTEANVVEPDTNVNETTTIDDDDVGRVRTLAPWLDYDDSVWNPRPGYEPYWPVGEWVYKETFTTQYTSTSTLPPLVGGRPCPKYYRHIKETCTTRLSGYWKTEGCNYENWCWNDMDNIYAYHTFPTFCDYLHYYYKYSQYHRSVFVHTGNCTVYKPYYHPFNPMYDTEHVIERYDHWMKKLNQTFFNLTTERDITLGPPVIKYGDKK